MEPELPSILVRGKLNLVGEYHSESDERRKWEKAFAKQETGSDNYWIEDNFPDLHQKVGIREKRGGQEQAKGADLMEFRAVHAASMLIGAFEQLAGQASEVAKTPAPSAKAMVYTFLNEKIRNFKDVEKRIKNTWQPTESADVNTAVNALFTYVENARATYLAALRDAPPEQLLQATKDLADKSNALRDLLPPLVKAVGAPKSADFATLAHDMRVERSTFMGLGAVWSKQVGVWKVGDFHIKDLTDGTVKIDASRINIVSREAFNQAFEPWKLGMIQQYQQWKLQKQTLQQDKT